MTTHRLAAILAVDVVGLRRGLLLKDGPGRCASGCYSITSSATLAEKLKTLLGQPYGED
jgi:hypothetical protein